jgi:membrane protein YdbS with pleckstrin-like domain
MDKEILTVLEPKEEIVWQGLVSRKIIAFNLVISLLIIAVISFLIFSQGIVNYKFDNMPKIISGTTLGFIIIIIGIIVSVINFLFDYVKKYIVTNKRVLIRSGLIGTDFNSIYLTEVKTVNVNVGLIDKIFSVGTINIDTGKIETITSGDGHNTQSRTQTAYDKLLSVDNPYEAYKYFQTALTERQESLYSGRADIKNNQNSLK